MRYIKTIIIYTSFFIVNLLLTNKILLSEENTQDTSIGIFEKEHIGNPDSIKSGSKKYATNCLFCHGPKGKGSRAPTLVANGFIPDGVYDNKFFITTIKYGRSGTIMGAFEKILSATDMWHIVAYLRNQAQIVADENN